MAQRLQSRFWLFTLNNPDGLYDSDLAEGIADGWLRYYIFQEEQGGEGTDHLQGYVEFRIQQRLSFVRRIIPAAHWERRRGSQAEAIDYCSKVDTRISGPYSGGQPSRGQGSRTDLQELKTELDRGTSLREVSDMYFGNFLRYSRGIREYMLLHRSRRDWKTVVVLYYGPTNTGKSSTCRALYPDAYWKPRGNWWDGYDGHEVVIIDEYYGWLPFDTLLRLTDRYPMLVETKGGTVEFLARKIVITTNSRPDRWYQRGNFAALARRIEKWCVFETPFAELDTLDSAEVFYNFEAFVLYCAEHDLQ